MFRKISVFKGLLISAVNSGERAKLIAQDNLLKKKIAGYTNIENECSHCN
jgi:hypothetical protein